MTSLTVFRQFHSKTHSLRLQNIKRDTSFNIKIHLNRNHTCTICRVTVVKQGTVYQWNHMNYFIFQKVLWISSSVFILFCTLPHILHVNTTQNWILLNSWSHWDWWMQFSEHFATIGQVVEQTNRHCNSFKKAFFFVLQFKILRISTSTLICPSVPPAVFLFPLEHKLRPLLRFDSAPSLPLRLCRSGSRSSSQDLVRETRPPPGWSLRVRPASRAAAKSAVRWWMPGFQRWAAQTDDLSTEKHCCVHSICT